MQLSQILNQINLPKIICDHALGKNHHHAHRMVAGGFIIAIGMVLGKLFEEVMVLNYCLEIFSEGVKGMGVVPFIDFIQQKLEA